MKNKKIIKIALMGLSIMAFLPFGKIVSFAVNTDYINGAGMDFGSGFDKDRIKYRPTEGYINEGLWFKNPQFPLNNSNETYYRNKQKVANKLVDKYSYQLYYYEPNGYGSQFESIPENKHATWWRDNSTWRPRNTYGVNLNVTYRTNTPNNYAQSHNETDYRFSGYSMLGNAIQNPYFTRDIQRDAQNFGNVNLISCNIHGKNTAPGSVSYNKDNKTLFDDNDFYSEKLKAIKRLMAVEPSLRTGKIRYAKADGSLHQWAISSNIDTAAKQWAEVLSLQSHPVWETPIFIGRGVGHYSTAMAPVSPQLSEVRDLAIKTIIVKDSNGTIVGKGYREGKNWIQTQYINISPYKNYSIEYEVHNYGKTATTINPTEIKTGFALNDNALKHGENNKFPENDSNKNKTLTNPVTVNGGQSIKFTRTEMTPANLVNGWKSSAYISEKHNGDDNTDTTNDSGYVMFKNVSLSDVSAEDVYYVNKSGNRVTKLMPGEEYKVGFKFKYTGSKLDKAVNLYFKGTVERFYPQSPTNTSEVKTYTFSALNQTLTNGKIFEFETPEFMVFEQPKVNTTAVVQISDKAINSNPNNDYYKESYNDDYDYKIEWLKVIPHYESPLKDGFITIGVMYDVNLTVPPHVAGQKDFDILTEITLPNGVFSVTDHVKTGITRGIVHKIQIPVNKLVSGSKNYPVSVLINADKHKWETDILTQTNNKGTTSLVINAPLNPNDFVNYTGCPIDSKNNNSWIVKHEISPFNGEYTGYSKFDNSKYYSFYNYKKSYAQSMDVKYYNESYKIDNVLFKSKETVDKKYGENGWINLMTSGSKALVKAGYGYELEVNVTYKNNVIGKQPVEIWNKNVSNSRGQTISNLQVPANINNDIYVRTDDKKVLSATGMFGTIKAFKATVVSNTDNEVKIKYSMDTKLVNGINESLKIFTNENAMDNRHLLNVYTPVMNGIGSNEEKSQLCDSSRMSFKIQGSMHDDNSDHIVQ